MTRISAILTNALILFAAPIVLYAQDLGSWNDTGTKRAILDFVKDATTSGGPRFVRPEDRIAVFDFDGTLIVEQPSYSQMLFCTERIESRGGPEAAQFLQKPPKTKLETQLNAFDRDERRRFWGLGMAGASGAQVQERAHEWLTRARHPRYQRPWSELLYTPMLDLIRFLKEKEFRVFIVTGSVSDYVRAISEEFLGIPKENVIGSSLVHQWRLEDPAEVERTETFADMVDGEAKVLKIDRHIGRRPIMTFGNSDGDLAMVAYTTAGSAPGFGAFVHHDDAVREYAYDRGSPVGQLKEGLRRAPQMGWRLISMKKDWKRLFASDNDK